MRQEIKILPTAGSLTWFVSVLHISKFLIYYIEIKYLVSTVVVCVTILWDSKKMTEIYKSASASSSKGIFHLNRNTDKAYSIKHFDLKLPFYSIN